MTFASDLIECVDAGRRIVDDLGLRPYLVRTQKRTWSGPEKGEGTFSDVLVTFDPQPRVSEPSPRRVYDAPGRYEDGDRILKKLSATLTIATDLDPDLGKLEEFWYLIDDQAYRVARVVELHNFERVVHLRRINRKVSP